MAESKKNTYIVTSAHAIIGESGAPSATLEPGGRVLLNEEADSHKFLKAQIEASNPDYAHLSLVEIDHKAEAKQEEERAELLKKADKIAAKQREEQAEELREQQEGAQPEPLEGQPSVNAGTDFPPQDVRAQELAEQSGAGQRASTQADVVEGGSKAVASKRAAKKPPAR